MTPEIATTETAPTPALQADMGQWQQRIDRLEAEAPALAGTGDYPGWYYEDREPLEHLDTEVRAQGVEPAALSQYYQLFAREQGVRAQIDTYPYDGHPFELFTHRMGEDFVGHALQIEPADGPIHTAMLECLGREVQKTNGVITTEIDVLKNAYNVDNVTQLLGIGGDEYSDQIRQLLTTERGINGLRWIDQQKGDDFEWKDTQEAARTWMAQAVEAATGMPAAEAADYVFTASRRAENTDALDVLKKFDHFGVERIRAITAVTGIHSLEAYSDEQLERMSEFAQNPAELAERLADHDVTVVMSNRFGDYNGVLKTAVANFEDDAKRTLFFEITHMSDIYKQMAMLREAGIKPSTLVLAAHSAPGEFTVSDKRSKDSKQHRYDVATVAGRELVAMLNATGELSDQEFQYSMRGMKGMARLVESYMQPSRGIDDADADTGRAKIIFQACDAGTEITAKNLDANGEKTDSGLESVISQLGKDLIASGLKSKIDIYGAATGIQLHRTDKGVHYSAQPKALFDEPFIRPHQPAERIRLESGQLKHETVQDIALRK